MTTKEAAKIIRQLYCIDRTKLPEIGLSEDLPEAAAHILDSLGLTEEESGALIDDLGLMPSTRNTLVRNGIKTLNDLYALKSTQLRCLPQFGERCMQDLNEQLKKLGYVTFR